jgi:tripartite-type tricarboxylate transporter receptor subunit TctC
MRKRFQDGAGISMKLPRRHFLGLLAGAAILPAAVNIARAQAYPTRPVRIIVGFAAGGVTDLGARLIGQWLSDRLGQPFIIENMPGAGTQLAAEAVIRAPADGYTLLMASSTNAINVTLYDKPNYNFVRDIAPIASVVRFPLVLEVDPAVPVKTVPELIAYAQANPRTVTMASFGVGTGSHLAGEEFKMMAGIDMIHVPYRGSGPMLSDLLGSHVQVAFDNLPSSIEHIRAGKLRALAVTTATRLDALPDVPTLAEFLPGYEASSWIGVGAPKSTPTDIIATLNKEINAALSDPKIRARLADLSATVIVGSPADFGKIIAEDIEKWGNVIRIAKIKPE